MSKQEPLMLGYNKAGFEEGGKILGKLIMWIFGIFVFLVFIVSLLIFL